jgi:nitrate reductase NapAB chaperone NapD
MVISALVLTLTTGSARFDLLRTLAAMPGVQLGDLAPTGRLPLAVESADPAAARELLRLLEALAGVAHVDVVGVYFGEEAGVTEGETERRVA